MMAPAEVRALFFSALFPSQLGRIELRALPSRARAFFRHGDQAGLERFVSEHGAENVYVGIAVRGPAERGSLGNCVALEVMFVDIDFKTTSELEARTRLAEFPFPPTMLVHSGAGLHAYWTLLDPLMLPQDEPRAREVLWRLAAKFGGDLSAAEPARVLRLPGSANFKYAPPRPVVLEAVSGTHVLPDDLLQFLPADEEAPSLARRFQVPAEPVGPGERNGFLYRLSRSLKARRLSATAILAAARVANAEQCTPPHEDAEVCRVVAQAMAQPDRDPLPATLAGAARGATLTAWAHRGRAWGLNAEEVRALLLAMNRGRCRPPLAVAIVAAIAEGPRGSDGRPPGPTTETVRVWVG